MATPKKSVHWGTDNSFSDTASSPSFSSTSSDHSSSTFEYLNSQLIAHGFAPPPGLSLDGVSNANAERIAKCLLELLGQRTNDLARTEDLSTKLRVLQYDYERMQSMHRAAENNADNAEREMNLHKSRLAIANKVLHAAEAAHKQTSAELQRTRSTLQSIRTAHQTELKKKEREVERMTERWSKVADVQAKLSNVPAGITCANAQVVEGTELLGNGPGVFQVALEQADQARGQLSTENIRLKKLVLRTVNQLHALMYRAYHPENDDDPPEVMMDNLFPLNPPDAAEQRVTMIISNFENTLASISSETRPLGVPIQEFEPLPNPRHEAEISRLQDTISALRQDIQRLQEESSAQVQEAQSQFEQYVQRHEKLIVVAEHASSQEKERLNQVTRDLERDRRAVAEEAKKLQKDKATFDVEKSSWEAQMMPVDNPPLPQPTVVASDQPATAATRRASQRIQKRAQTKSPARTFKVGKSNRRRAVTTAQVRQLASPGTRKVVPSYQTEVIPVPAITLTGTSESLSPGKALLTTSFVLPPPSPQASLPNLPMDLGQPIPPPQFLTSFSLSKLPELPSPESSDNPSSSHTPLESPPSMDEDNFMAPLTRGYPVAKPHAQRMVHAYSPVKPSPLSRVLVAVNSPDSNSSNDGKDSSSSASLGPLSKGAASMPGRRLFPSEAEKEDEEMPLAQQLGIPVSPPESSLKRKRVNSSGFIAGTHQRHKPSSSRDRVVHANAETTGKGRVLVRDSHTSSTVTRKRGKAASESADATSDKATSSKNHSTSTRTASSASGPTASSSSKAPESSKSVSQVEKENKRDDSAKRRSTTSASSSSSKASKPAADGKAADVASGNVRGGSTKPSSSSSSSQPIGTNATSARARLLAKLPPSSRGTAVSGPRRILVDTPESETSDKKGSKG
ncbi:hypothetical protein M378DRAFT_195916 [Amanita muscaria Koide BX008]|uniref:Afadin and alpha-actinin-binding-domain-containing protein n=1 Tax=Amanita muscaria (strain Koide BX008) TaxID=946122 RepID=A0A0C2X4F5_AMAMK|nr:hypothetical protein M378DRAFT_195916 [Amanita muscaria Koide BX008]